MPFRSLNEFIRQHSKYKDRNDMVASQKQELKAQLLQSVQKLEESVQRGLVIRR